MNSIKIKQQIDETISKIPNKKLLNILKLSQYQYDILKDGKHLTKAGKYKGMTLRITEGLPYGTMYVTIR